VEGSLLGLGGRRFSAREWPVIFPDSAICTAHAGAGMKLCRCDTDTMQMRLSNITSALPSRLSDYSSSRPICFRHDVYDTCHRLSSTVTVSTLLLDPCPREGRDNPPS